MMDSWVTVASFGTLPEAELARNRLEQDGIHAHLSDGESVSMMWMYSTALGGVKLMVAEEDAERAGYILERVWRGARHKHTDDYGLEETITDRPGKVRVEPVEDAPPAEEDEDEVATSEKDKYARMAWRTAVIGLVLCPGILHFFSIYTLLEIGEAKGELTRAGRRCILGTIVVNVLLVLAVVAFIIAALSR
jgi:hypothetical protein